jgi:uncharacterized protein with ParB-like and HNH nuclease domain
MKSYKAKKIIDIIREIGENQIYLPTIQRKFVWKTWQITDLFDSIMKGYPIGTFLFWKLEGENIQPYTFYSFISDYDVRDPNNKTTNKPEMRDVIFAVVDGQQRLSSMYVALQGSYTIKKPHSRKPDNDDSAFQKKKLCLNLLCKLEEDYDEEKEIESNYDFRFLIDDEIEYHYEKEFWFPVRKVLEWKEDIKKCNEYAEEKGYGENKIFKENLTLLWNKINKEELICYFEINYSDIAKILPIFVRINSSGTPLKRNDLLFSTIVATWENARQEIELLIKTINKKGEYFDFNNEFIMRSCLVLTDSPVLYKVKTFKKENIQKIRDNWERIKDAINRAVDLIVEFGFNERRLESKMAVIPIAYYLYHNHKLNATTKQEIRKYLIFALLNRIYGGKPDQIITKIRDSIKDNTYIFSLQKINDKLDSDNNLSISDERLREILSETKGNYTFMVLSLLYPNLKLNHINFHQDHIHPNSKFDYDNLKASGLIQEGESIYSNDVYCKKDKLPNLQLLEGIENASKNNTPFKEWFSKNIKDKNDYKEKNFIPLDVDLDFKMFNEFYKQREELLKSRLQDILKI